MLTVLGGLAEFERDLIRAPTGEGRERAKARGVKMGRKPKLTPHQRAEAIKRRDTGEPMRDIGKSLQRLAQRDLPAESVRCLGKHCPTRTRSSRAISPREAIRFLIDESLGSGTIEFL
jgi:hypothetical protein